MPFRKLSVQRKKSVCLISTMHADPAVDEGTKKRPNVVLFYNKNKVGVDVVDQMVRQHSTRCATRRWPVGVWSNVLDLAALNAWILYKKSTSSKISRKKFILQLVEELRCCYVQSLQTRRSPEETAELENNSPATKKRKKRHGNRCNNVTITICRTCKMPTCGKCAVDQTKLVIVVCKRCEIS